MRISQRRDAYDVAGFDKSLGCLGTGSRANEKRASRKVQEYAKECTVSGYYLAVVAAMVEQFRYEHELHHPPFGSSERPTLVRVAVDLAHELLSRQCGKPGKFEMQNVVENRSDNGSDRFLAAAEA